MSNPVFYIDDDGNGRWHTGNSDNTSDFTFFSWPRLGTVNIPMCPHKRVAINKNGAKCSDCGRFQKHKEVPDASQS